MHPSFKSVVQPMLKPPLNKIAHQRLKRLIASTSGPFLIEVGASQSRHDGWIPTDISPRARYYMDATKQWPFPAGSATAVFADNVIEHVTMTGARAILAQSFRALRPGGEIRLATPDIERAARIYLARDEATEWHLANANRHGYEAHYPVDILRSTFQDSGHHAGYLWDELSLTTELSSAGFLNIRRFETGESDNELFHGIDRMEDMPQSPFSLVLQATRP